MLKETTRQNEDLIKKAAENKNNLEGKEELRNEVEKLNKELNDTKSSAAKIRNDAAIIVEQYQRNQKITIATMRQNENLKRNSREDE
jgi:hypothetical protein